MKTVFRIFTLCALFALGGCGAKQKSVHVVDDLGKPVSGARVCVQSGSIEGTPTLTDDDGSAGVDVDVPNARSINISKEGYYSQQVSIPSKWPITVILIKRR